jgi:two-component system nitrate/nitrite response regulator NarL
VTPARIVIADDHRIFRSGLRSLLETEPEFSVVGEASDGDEAEALVKKLAPDALLLDLSMPKRSGVEVLASLAATPGPTRTILLTAGVDTGEIIAALQQGARGVVLKASAIEQLLDGIRCVLAGQFWVEGTSVPSLAAALELFRPAAVPSKNTFNLTPREIEIITALVGGASNRELAKQFSLSEDTVKHHLTNAFNKTGASTRLELALFALHHGIVRSTAGR